MVENFGRYKILEELARGAYGIVYKALDTDLDRPVALKALRDGPAGPVAHERFIREARLAAGLSHPNVVQVFETGEHQGRPFYTMALLEGAPPRGPMEPAEACRLMSRVADAAAHAHARGVLHRDLKPANIVVCGGEPVLMDFGLARSMGDVRVTETGELLGTPAYMSPEQIGGRGKEADGKSDVFALGVILFELLTGRLPFEADSFVELSAAIQNDPPPPLPGYHPALAALVHRCLAKKPSDRPAASAVARELGRWVPGQRGRWPLTACVLAALAGSALWAFASSEAPRPTGDMVRIPGGTYDVGDPRINRRPVTLPEFWIDSGEVKARKGGYSFEDALKACLRKGKRLPTEEEWEVAAGGRLFPWGEEADPSRAACEGARGPNPRDVSPWGCRDMAGNLQEWTGTIGRLGETHRVARGGHWLRPIDGCTTYAREELKVARRVPTLGYRCARSHPPEEENGH